MTHQQFHFPRWRALVAKQWGENRRRYLLALLAVAGLIAAWEAFMIGMDDYALLDPTMQFATYMSGLWFVGCLYASTLFADLGSRKQALPWLSLPASHLEKLLCALVFGVAGFFIAYTVVFYLVNIPMVYWANSILSHHPRNWPGSNNPIPPSRVYNFITALGSPDPEKNFRLLTAGYFAAQSVFILGSVYFSRFAFFKTVVGILLFILATAVFQRIIINPMLPTGWNNNVLHWSQDANGQEIVTREVRLAYPIEPALILVMQLTLAPFFWLVTWFRLKEKEV
jgi:hypothetical protein